MRTIPLQETLMVEFKSDTAKLVDDELRQPIFVRSVRIKHFACCANLHGRESWRGRVNIEAHTIHQDINQRKELRARA
jgi:hypothetical protein